MFPLESALLRNTDFSENVGTLGTIWHKGLGHVAVERCRFLDNRSSGDAGAILADYGAGGVRIDRCTFDGNRATGDGGALLSWPELTVTRSCFLKNSGFRGGAICQKSHDLYAHDCLFHGNRATDAGGAIANLEGASGELRQAILFANHAPIGGGIWNEDSNLTVASAVFFANRASFGGAVANDTGTLKLLGTTLAANRADVIGGGIVTGPTALVRNSILWANVEGAGDDSFVDEFAQVQGARFATINFSAVQGWTGQFGGTGNAGDDPMFVDPLGPDDEAGTEDDNYRLHPDSPLINAGDPNFAADPTDADLDGHARVLCGRVDMGAYEFGIGDFNCDRVTELADFAAWPACMTGPAVHETETPLYPEGCEAFDLHANGATDLHDYAGYQRLPLAQATQSSSTPPLHLYWSIIGPAGGPARAREPDEAQGRGWHANFRRAADSHRRNRVTEASDVEQPHALGARLP